jgi:gamma-glutamylcyclotransferase (GGCT)/AIG2-like uncharacterized protein YtfP
MKQYVFAYGTLRIESVRRELLGYSLASYPAMLKGFSLSTIVLDNTEYPIIIETPDSQEVIEGEYFEVDQSDLKKLDDYESSAYRRIKVTLENQIVSWVYTQ